MLFKSPLPKIKIPEISLPYLVMSKTEQLGSKPALIDGSSGNAISYSELGIKAKRLASGLSKRGFKPGEVLGIFSPNCPEYGIIFHGVILAGGTNTTVNPLYTAEELSKQLNDCQARFLICHSSCLETALKDLRTGFEQTADFITVVININQRILVELLRHFLVNFIFDGTEFSEQSVKLNRYLLHSVWILKIVTY